jgi:DNA invertase Pin-like site-specific DNA recombinase
MKIGYARVSTQDQSLEAQVELLRNSGCDTVYQEKVGAMKDRPELDRLLETIRSGDIVVICKLDRLGRSIRHLLKLVDILRLKSVELISLKDNIDTTTSHGRFMFNILASVAEFEREMISERTKSTLQHLKDKGIKLGRPQWLSDESIARAKQAKKLRKLNHTVKFICDELNISRRTCYKYLNY